MANGYSGNLRVMDAGGITQSVLGVRYNEDNSPKSGVVFGVNTVSKLEIYHTDSLVLLPANWREWSLPDRLPPTGLLCVHTEDYPLGDADNVLAEAERLRGKVLNEMRDAGNATETAGDGSGVDTPTPGQAPKSNDAPVEAFDVRDTNRDGVVSKSERKGKV